MNYLLLFYLLLLFLLLFIIIIILRFLEHYGKDGFGVGSLQ